MVAEPAKWSRLSTVHGMDPADVYVEFGTYRLVLTRPGWQTYAACRGVGADVFFPERGGTLAAARELCSRCPVRPQCLAFALEVDADGYWAGTSERDRRRLARARRREAA